MLQGVTEVAPVAFPCVECKEKPATRRMIIGKFSLSLCDGCYVEVWNRPRPLNRRGRREAIQQQKAENRKNGIPNRVRIVALLDTSLGEGEPNADGTTAEDETGRSGLEVSGL